MQDGCQFLYYRAVVFLKRAAAFVKRDQGFTRYCAKKASTRCVYSVVWAASAPT